MSVKRKIKQMEKRCFTEREQLFEAFFKEFFSWGAQNVGCWIAAGFFEFFLIIFMWIPIQNMQETANLFGVMGPFMFFGATLYIRPYVQFQEGVQAEKKELSARESSIYEKLQYLPLSLKELQIYRTKKLAIFCFKMFFVFLVGQIFFSVVVYHGLSLLNILYVVICGFVIPFGIGGISARFSK